jgi:Nucleoside diphosphate kinase
VRVYWLVLGHVLKQHDLYYLVGEWFVSPLPLLRLPYRNIYVQGKDACKEGRKMLGATMPSDSAMGTIRGDFCLDVGRNVIHGSDSVESAQKEIALWFPEGVAAYESCQKAWVYE